MTYITFCMEFHHTHSSLQAMVAVAVHALLQLSCTQRPTLVHNATISCDADIALHSLHSALYMLILITVDHRTGLLIGGSLTV